MDGFYIHIEELSKFGISENIFFRNIGILKSIFDEEWLLKQEYNFNRHPFAKRSMEPLFNRHPVYGAFNSTTLEDLLYLYFIGECFFSLSNIKNIGTYIPRLKSENEIKSAFFELLIGKTFIEMGFNIEGLQIKNNLGNPVELLVENNGNRYWIECKSTFDKPFRDDLLERIISTANDVMKGKGKNILFRLIIESEIKDIFVINKKLLKDIKELMNGVYNLSDEEFPILVYDEGQSSDVKWKLECHLFEKIEEETVHSFITNECDKGCAHAKVRKSSSNSGLPNLSSPPQYSAIFGVKYLYGEYSKRDQIKITKICDQIKEKIKQQENLLSNDEKVLIIFDEDIIDSHDIALIKNELKVDNENLGIFIASRNHPSFEYRLQEVYLGDNLVRTKFNNLINPPLS